MLVDLWRADGPSIDIGPETAVYTLKLTWAFDRECNDLCDRAYTTLAEVKQHFWIKPGLDEAFGERRADILIMPFRDYIALHLDEIRGMNPFWDLGRAEFLAKWTLKHGEPMPRVRGAASART